MCSPGMERPIVWQISKVENAQPFGICKFTLYQTEWNENIDFIDEEAIAAGDLFAYYADYYANEGSTLPTDEPAKDDSIRLEVFSSSTSVKIGGSSRTVEAIVWNGEENITDSLVHSMFVWSAVIDGAPVPTENIEWSDGPTRNSIVFKLAKNRKYIGKTLDITCTMNNTLTATKQFDIGAI